MSGDIVSGAILSGAMVIRSMGISPADGTGVGGRGCGNEGPAAETKKMKRTVAAAVFMGIYYHGTGSRDNSILPRFISTVGSMNRVNLRLFMKIENFHE